VTTARCVSGWERAWTCTRRPGAESGSEAVNCRQISDLAQSPVTPLCLCQLVRHPENTIKGQGVPDRRCIAAMPLLRCANYRRKICPRAAVGPI